MKKEGKKKIRDLEQNKTYVEGYNKKLKEIDIAPTLTTSRSKVLVISKKHLNKKGLEK